MKKWLKILLIILLGLIGVLASLFGYFYYDYVGKYDVDKEKYPHHIGFLSTDNIDYSENFKRCSDELPVGFYSSAHNAFKSNKGVFRKFILQNFKNRDYPDTGFLNLRFIINCRGEIGDMEINELDVDLSPTKFNSDLVKQIIELTIQENNWQVHSSEEPRDMYMYLIYKIENGEIIELLP